MFPACQCPALGVSKGFSGGDWGEVGWGEVSFCFVLFCFLPVYFPHLAQQLAPAAARGGCQLGSVGLSLLWDVCKDDPHGLLLPPHLAVPPNGCWPVPAVAGCH